MITSRIQFGIWQGQIPLLRHEIAQLVDLGPRADHKRLAACRLSLKLLERDVLQYLRGAPADVDVEEDLEPLHATPLVEPRPSTPPDEPVPTLAETAEPTLFG